MAPRLAAHAEGIKNLDERIRQLSIESLTVIREDPVFRTKSGDALDDLVSQIKGSITQLEAYHFVILHNLSPFWRNKFVHPPPIPKKADKTH